MDHVNIKCPHCRAVPPWPSLQDAQVQCVSCRKVLYINIFPALLKTLRKGQLAETAVVAEDARCYFHDEHVAVQACGQCGVFMCSLCDLEVDNRHLCPRCFNQDEDLHNAYIGKAVLYDSMLLRAIPISYLVSGLFCNILVLIFAPMIFIGSIVFWNRVKTPYPRGKWRMAIALLLSGLQLLLFTSFIAFFIWGIVSGELD